MKVKLRHKIIFWFLYWCVGPFLRLVYYYRRDVMKQVPGPALIVSNHTTDLDPALVAMSFRKTMGFVASEHVGRMGVASALLRFAFPMMVRQKGKTDAKSGMQILRALRAGTSLCLFAEGNRSYTGLTGPIFPATGKLAKASGATLITYRLTGGYFASPRWSARRRKGPITGAPVAVYDPARLAGMTAEEVNDAIRRDIAEDAYARQAAQPVAYRGEGLAEHLETALYLCPACGKVGTLHSHGDSFACGCGLAGQIDAYGTLSGEGLPYATVRDWDLWQATQTGRLVTAAGGRAIFADAGDTLHRLDPEQGDVMVATGEVALYADRLCCPARTFALGEIAGLAITGRQTLAFSTADGANWELKNPAPRSALKYLRAYECLTAKTAAPKAEPSP